MRRYNGRVAVPSTKYTFPEPLMRRDTQFPIGIIRNTLEYTEARVLLAQHAEIKQHLQELKFVLRVLRRLSPEAVLLAARDLAEQNDDAT